jgi:hypothetical protein
MKDRRDIRYNKDAKKYQAKKYISSYGITVADENRFMIELAKIRKERMMSRALAIILN